MWCSPGCKVDEKVVFLCRKPNSQQLPSQNLAYASHYNMSAQIRGRSVWVPPVENPNEQPNRYSICKVTINITTIDTSKTSCRSPEERNVNGRRGELNSRKLEEDPKEPAPHPRPGSRPSVRPNAMKNRGKQLEALKQMEERIKKLQVPINNNQNKAKKLQRRPPIP